MTTSAASPEDWKLSTNEYNEAIRSLENEGIDTGREKTKTDKEDKPKKISVPFDVVSDKILKLFPIFTMRDTKQIYISMLYPIKF